MKSKALAALRRPSLVACALSLAPATLAPAAAGIEQEPTAALSEAALRAQRQLHETFSNLQFDDFAPAPIEGPIYQATAGGRTVYYAPASEHILFAAVYDKNGVNVTALAEDAAARKKLAAIDPAKALALGPVSARTVIEFTDPDCPYCRALEKYWIAKAVEGRPVRRLVYFVSGIHPQSAAKAEHILCSPDQEAEFQAIYGGSQPDQLRRCAMGRSKVEADAEVTRKIGISGTPTLIVDGKLISGFREGELERLMAARPAKPDASR